MLITISGAASTGKSTLLEDLKIPVETLAATAGITVVWHQERARLVFEEKYASKYPGLADVLATEPLNYQLDLAEAFAADVAEVMANPATLYIADRSGFDVAVYTMLLGGKGPEDAQKIERIFALIHEHIHGVDRMYLTDELPMGLVDDGFRPGQFADPATRAMEVAAFRHLALMHANCVRLPSTRFQRVAKVVGGIHELLAERHCTIKQLREAA